MYWEKLNDDSSGFNGFDDKFVEFLGFEKCKGFENFVIKLIHTLKKESDLINY